MKLRKLVQYRIEEKYNSRFLQAHNLHPGEEACPAPIAGGNHNQVVWLRNIDRLLHLAGSLDRAEKLVDLGCGAGIAMCYFSARLGWREVEGVEINPKLVRIARENFLNLDTQGSLTVIQGEAQSYSVTGQCTLFAFNPFDQKTMREFLRLNSDEFSRTKPKILLANDHLLRTVLEFGELLNRNSRLNLSVVKLGEN